MKKFIVPVCLLLVFLISSCGNPAAVVPDSTATPIPPSPTQPGPTITPIPPTPAPSVTPIPPTLKPTSTLDDQITSIQTYLESLEESDAFSGVVLIAQQGVPVFQAAYGLADRELEIPNQIDTKFNLGSMDKMFTATAIMQLVEQGKVALDATIDTYLPNYPNSEIASSITIHQLLTHTSGMGNYFDSPLYLDLHNSLRSLKDYLALFADTPPLFPPDYQWSYSNSGYIVLGLIIEAVTGQNYYDYVKEHIFVPSGMENTACYELDAGTPNLAIGYTYLDWYENVSDQISDNESMMPIRGGSAGGGYSTAQDLLAFGNALMSYQFLSPESTELMLEGKVQLNDYVWYAYGFFNRTDLGTRMIGHGGGFPGICSLLAIYPEPGYTVIILTNSDDNCLTANDYILSILFE